MTARRSFRQRADPRFSRAETDAAAGDEAAPSLEDYEVALVYTSHGPAGQSCGQFALQPSRHSHPDPLPCSPVRHNTEFKIYLPTTVLLVGRDLVDA